MRRGFAYLTVIIDWYSRYIVGWQLSNTLEAEGQVELISRLISTHGKPAIINSDQGSQYTRSTGVSFLRSRRISISMDGKGRAMDNALVERFFRTLKQECIYLHPTDKMQELRAQIQKYIDYYNEERAHQGINRKIPVNLYRNGNENTTTNKKSVA